MTVFLAEKNLSGLCCALFFAFTEKIFPDFITDEKLYTRNLTDNYVKIQTEPEKTQRVLRAIFKYAGNRAADPILLCLASDDEKAFKAAFDYSCLILQKRRAVYENLADKRVSDFVYTVKKVAAEIHRIKGFLRFKETENGVLYAPFSPDNDITEFICPHFVRRFFLIPFAIHDLKRRKVGISDGKNFKIFFTDETAAIALSADEKSWENLWKKYYKAVNIKERKNKKQQDNLMPLRYRKFLPETYE